VAARASRRKGFAVIVSANNPGVNGSALPAGARFPSATPRPGNSPGAQFWVILGGAEDGGGIYDVGAQPESSLQLTNDKITGNYASADGGGIYNEAGALPIGVLTLAHTTVSSNDAGSLGAASTTRGRWPPLTLRSAVTPHAGVAASTRRSTVTAMASR
jgi:hypothetical protein